MSSGSCFMTLFCRAASARKVSAVLAGVEAEKTANLKLDSEGGAQATSPKSRHLQTGIALGLAAVSAAGDGDADILNKGAGGANGFKLVGIAVGIAARSNSLGIVVGALGASQVFLRTFHRAWPRRSLPRKHRDADRHRRSPGTLSKAFAAIASPLSFFLDTEFTLARNLWATA